ncbi:acetophenone carboxylase [Mycolicibacterium sp. CH28]|jgi:acetone carboxylase gamma subunit|uniref:acetone carboxylase subunit gamma n=1 Tax=Mycolicibacterium sp. CH28 TaxID=2512237 RepID=UPI0010802FBD|nr:acetone carboxylase subunit gamma [Mycolicibacterium sp. CH28]TGD89114.1 acetophenone carboxylase [Mycolicibacterium sp. CH28]
MRIRITEHLDIDLDTELWRCNRCGAELGSARDSYKRGLLVASRDPAEVHFARAPKDADYSFAPHPDWCRIVEFYCPACAQLIETEYLPPGHPVTHDLELDLDALRARTAELVPDPS